MKTADTTHEPTSDVTTAVRADETAPQALTTEPSAAGTARGPDAPTPLRELARSPKSWAVTLTAFLLGTWLLGTDPSGDARARVRTWIAASPAYSFHSDYIDALLDRHHEPTFRANYTTDPSGTMQFDQARYRYQLFFAMWSQAEAESRAQVAMALRRVYERQKEHSEE